MGLSFVDFFVGYGEYHNNLINKIIHFIFVPTILWTSMALLLHLNVFSYDVFGIPNLEVNHVFVFMTILALVYIYVDIPTGIFSSIMYFCSLYFANMLYNQAVAENQKGFHFTWNLMLFLFAWVIQFIGHGVFEGRKPALIDNILQIFVAPDFIVIQWFFYLGYRHSEYVEIKKKIHNNINQWKKQANQTKSQ